MSNEHNELQHRVDEARLKLGFVGVASVLGIAVVAGALGRLILGPDRWPTILLITTGNLVVGVAIGTLLGAFVFILSAAFGLSDASDSRTAPYVAIGIQWAGSPLPKWLAIAGPLLGLAWAVTAAIWHGTAHLIARLAFAIALWAPPIVALIAVRRIIRDTQDGSAEPGVPPERAPRCAPRKSTISISRMLFAGIAGAALGWLLSTSVLIGIGSGLSLMLPGDDFRATSYWPEHPVLRVVSAAVASVVGGYVAGNIAARWRLFWAATTAMPGLLVWGAAAVVVATEGGQTPSWWAVMLGVLLVSPTAAVVGGRAGTQDHLNAGASLGAVRVFHWLWLIPCVVLATSFATAALFSSFRSTFSWAGLTIARLIGVPEVSWDWLGLPRPDDVKGTIIGTIIGATGAIPTSLLLKTLADLATPRGRGEVFKNVLFRVVVAVAVVWGGHNLLATLGWSPLPSVQAREERISLRKGQKLGRGGQPEWSRDYPALLSYIQLAGDKGRTITYRCGDQGKLSCTDQFRTSERGLVISMQVVDDASFDAEMHSFQLLTIFDMNGDGLPDGELLVRDGQVTCSDESIPVANFCALKTPGDELDDPAIQPFAAWDLRIRHAIEHFRPEINK